MTLSLKGKIDSDDKDWYFKTDKMLLSSNVCVGIDEILSEYFRLPISEKGQSIKITLEIGNE